jgi:hypothetical protein
LSQIYVVLKRMKNIEDYFKNVLGIKNFLLPQDAITFDSHNVALEQVQIEKSKKMVILLDQPLNSNTDTMLNKIIAALIQSFNLHSSQILIKTESELLLENFASSGDEEYLVVALTKTPHPAARFQTHSLESMHLDPTLKKSAWEELKKAAQIFVN